VLLEVSGVTVAYRGVEAVRDVSLVVREGEFVSVIGANGAGKTTLLKSVVGWEALAGGSVRFDGADISSKPAHSRAGAGIRIVPERARVFTRLTVHENLLMGAYGMRNDRRLKEKIGHLYDLFPILAERGGQLASTLSGGEQQQLSIARACISSPKLLLVDEVSMGLMPRLVDSVFELLQQLNKSEGLTILMVEQNALASLKISDRAYVLETGDIVLEGEADALLGDERVRAAYLGI
jgi:branched-chain amino acid transport system ATP-binding protein